MPSWIYILQNDNWLTYYGPCSFASPTYAGFAFYYLNYRGLGKRCQPTLVENPLILLNFVRHFLKCVYLIILD